MSQTLTGKKIMILAASGVEEGDLIATQRELLKTGATAHTVSPEQGLVNCWNKVGWGLYLPVDRHIGTTLAADYDMLIVPGGKRGVTKLSGNPHSERIISGFVAARKPMAFMGDAVELLAAVNHAKGITVSGPAESESALSEAGAVWSNKDFTADGPFLTMNSGSETVAFIEKIVQHFSGGEEIKAAA